MFPPTSSIEMLAARHQAQVLDTWREAAGLVATRWRVFPEVEPESRRWAFASYVAALDAEEAAATDLAASSNIAA